LYCKVNPVAMGLTRTLKETKIAAALGEGKGEKAQRTVIRQSVVINLKEGRKKTKVRRKEGVGGRPSIIRKTKLSREGEFPVRKRKEDGRPRPDA